MMHLEGECRNMRSSQQAEMLEIIFTGPFSICACHSCAAIMLIVFVSFQFYQKSPKGLQGIIFL